MKKILVIVSLMAAFAIGAVAQEGMKEKAQPTEADKTAAIPSGSYLKRGAAIGKAEKASLGKVLKDPAKFTGKTVLVEGVIVRSCKMEGCWAEMAAKKDGKSVRVKMKDHAFFIPLESAGAMARAEGVFQVKTLSKAMVDHMIEEDGAKFDNRNADGTVSELSFVASGIELKKAN